jgi:hypothetical protein
MTIGNVIGKERFSSCGVGPGVLEGVSLLKNVSDWSHGARQAEKTSQQKNIKSLQKP